MLNFQSQQAYGYVQISIDGPELKKIETPKKNNQFLLKNFSIDFPALQTLKILQLRPLDPFLRLPVGTVHLGVIWHRTNVGGVDGARGALGPERGKLTILGILG